jgi:hypothetical protein
VDEENRSLSLGSQCSEDTQDSNVKVHDKPRKKNRGKQKDVTSILSDAAESIGKLVSAVADRKADESSIAKAHEPDDDDWLFCKRLYIKLRKLPDGPFKEFFKVNTESEAVRMVYGQSAMRQQVQPTATQSTAGDYAAMLNSNEGLDMHYDGMGHHYTTM